MEGRRRMLLLCFSLATYCLVMSQYRQTYFCNAGTAFECLCSECWDTVAAEESLDWMTVSLMECPLRFNDTTLRTRIATWINEECGASLNCGLREPLNENRIVIGHFDCEPEKNELRLAALLNDTRGLNQENVLPAQVFGQVIQSREHLLSFLLQSEILSATVHRRLKGTPLTRTISGRSALAVMTALVIFIFFILLLVYFSQIYVNWSRIVKGEWNNRSYRKVPHVQYSSERIIVNGQLRTSDL